MSRATDGQAPYSDALPQPADGPSSAYPHFLHQSRVSVSTASSLSGVDGADDDEDGVLGASYHDVVSDDELAGGSGARRGARGSGAAEARRSKPMHDLDLEDPDTLADEVALIQKHRDGRTGFRRKAPPAPLGRLLGRVRGTVIVLSIICGAFVLIPLLQWLSSSPFASSPLGEALAAIPGVKNSTFYNLTIGTGTMDPAYKENTSPAIPEVGTLTGNLPSANKFGASANTEAGGWGLGRARAAGFLPHFHIAGWADPASAAHALGVTVVPGWSPASQASPDVKPDPSAGSGAEHLRQLTMDDVFDGTFSARTSDLAWAPEDPDEGVFSHVDQRTKDIILEDVTHARVNKTGQGKVAAGGGRVLYVKGDDVRDNRGGKLDWDSFKFSPNLRWVMFFSGRVKQWRHSSHSHVWLHDVLNKKTYPLKAPDTAPEQGPTIAYAQWIPLPNGAPGPNSPTQAPGPALAFVHKNDLYVALTPTSRPIRVTSDGAESIFNGVPDWVYEEEVFSSDFALWPSPTGSHLAYMRFDEREVPIYEYPIYNPNLWEAGHTDPYVQKVKMKYPKPGFPNPIVSVHSIDLDELRKHGGQGTGPTWQQVQAAKRNLVSPLKTNVPSNAGSDPALTVESVAKVDAAVAGGTEALKSRLVTEVVWITPDQVLIKESNRVADKMRAVVFDVGTAVKDNDSDLPPGDFKEREVIGTVVRSEDADLLGGWIEPFQTVRPLSPRNNSGLYIDLAPSKDGFRHIALFEPSSSFKPKFLTSGAWEVDKVKFVDTARNKVYFTAAYPTASQRHLFEASLSGEQVLAPKPLTDVSKPGFYDASFDPHGAYYTLYDQGPGIPSQRVLGLGSDPEKKKFELVLEDNAFLRQTLAMYVRPSTLYYSVQVNSQSSVRKGMNQVFKHDRRAPPATDATATLLDSVKVNISAREFRPHDFDASGRTRYPVLIYVYGGPNSQSVDASFARPDWHAYLASTLGYLVITIDGRGTGFQGFKHRYAVTGRLGELEASDVIEAARKISKLAYVDEKRVGIRGWSYGGYLTSKVIERDSGVFSLGMAVAPVTKWEFYDTIYTERYMKTPALNPDGYLSSAVHVSDGFRHADFFLASGSADDNVHPTNIYHLLDTLTAAQIRRYEFRHFTDSDHGISTRGAYRELHEFMTAFLQKRWGAGGKRKPVKLPPRGRIQSGATR
ncbi:Dipeptidyl peptidase 4 [Tilletia horrida]|uniref:Dipeptidyl peptidase 4 n=1 Tax=Tilletia horrida TaxID=155126 RepID=A0AAN6JHG9_9BASI|nr:Dipeptidyl peptidase 4 [Tilletia horrida]